MRKPVICWTLLCSFWEQNEKEKNKCNQNISSETLFMYKTEQYTWILLSFLTVIKIVQKCWRHDENEHEKVFWRTSFECVIAFIVLANPSLFFYLIQEVFTFEVAQRLKINTEFQFGFHALLFIFSSFRFCWI